MIHQNLQFIKLYNVGSDCSLTERVIFNYIVDRMNSSRQRYQFFDAQQNDFYVIFPVQELAEILNISHDTVSRSLTKLVNNNYLTIKRNKYHANKIFINEAYHDLLVASLFDQQPVVIANHAKDANSDASNAKSDANQTNTNHPNNTSITSVTKQVAPTNKPKASQVQPQVVVSDAIITSNLVNTLKQKNGLNANIISILLKQYGNDATKIYHVVGLLLKAKAKASQQLQQSLRFEDAQLTAVLEHSLYAILINANNRKKIKNTNAYLYSSFFKMFINAAQAATKVSPTGKYQVIINNVTQSRPKRPVKLPAWLQPGYQAPELSDTEFAALQAKNDYLMQRLGLKNTSTVKQQPAAPVEQPTVTALKPKLTNDEITTYVEQIFANF